MLSYKACYTAPPLSPDCSLGGSAPPCCGAAFPARCPRPRVPHEWRSPRGRNCGWTPPSPRPSGPRSWPGRPEGERWGTGSTPRPAGRSHPCGPPDWWRSWWAADPRPPQRGTGGVDEYICERLSNMKVYRKDMAAHRRLDTLICLCSRFLIIHNKPTLWNTFPHKQGSFLQMTSQGDP